ncbi:MAG: hypothetical protein J6N70_06640 [Oribacterium sp.]|nr:hypothetical protein [Oribacterium sp.]
MKRIVPLFWILLLFALCSSINANAETINNYTFDDVDWNYCYDSIKQAYDIEYKDNMSASPEKYDIIDSESSMLLHKCSLNNYNGEKFSDYLMSNEEDLLVCVEADAKIGVMTYSYLRQKAASEGMVFQGEKYPVNTKGKKQDLIRLADRYLDKKKDFKVYFVTYSILLEYAVVCDKNDKPLYVIYMEDITGGGKGGTANKLEEHFYYLLNDGIKGSDKQYVYDFDFFINLSKVYSGSLPDDYDYKPSALEAAYINKIYNINGMIYYYNMNGRCTGLYNGWAKSTKGRRYYRNGTYLTGKWRINGKEYRFDDNGYIMI